MPEKINDKKLIALKAQFKEAKTAHIFQIKIREFCKERYDELINAGVPKDQCVEKIRNQLTQLYLELTKDTPRKNKEAAIDKFKVLQKASKNFMQKNRFPPNVGYSDELVSEASEQSEEETVTFDAGYQFETAYILSRGIGYKTSGFDQFARSWHRSYSEGSMRPNYSLSAVNVGIAEYNKVHNTKFNLGDYFKGKYDNNKEFTALVEDACRKIADDFRFLRDERLSLKVNMDFNGRQELRTIAPIYLLQDIYTNDMTIFRKMINREQRKIFRENYAKTGHPFGEEKSTIDVLNRNGVLAKQNPETVMQLLNLLDGQEVDFHKRYSTLSVEAQVILIKLEQEKLKNSIERIASN